MGVCTTSETPGPLTDSRPCCQPNGLRSFPLQVHVQLLLSSKFEDYSYSYYGENLFTNMHMNQHITHTHTHTCTCTCTRTCTHTHTCTRTHTHTQTDYNNLCAHVQGLIINIAGNVVVSSYLHTCRCMMRKN